MHEYFDMLFSFMGLYYLIQWQYREWRLAKKVKLHKIPWIQLKKCADKLLWKDITVRPKHIHLVTHKYTLELRNQKKYTIVYVKKAGFYMNSARVMKTVMCEEIIFSSNHWEDLTIKVRYREGSPYAIKSHSDFHTELEKTDLKYCAKLLQLARTLNGQIKNTKGVCAA